MAVAKEAVEALQGQLNRTGRFDGRAETREAEQSPVRVPDDDPQLVERLLSVARTEGTIAAIKEHRQATGKGLKESKEAVEALLTAASVGRASSRPGATRDADATVTVSRGCAGSLLAMTLLAALILASRLYLASPLAAMTEEEEVVESILMQRAASNRALAERDFETFQQVLDADYQITRGDGGFGDADEAEGMVRELLASNPYTLYVRTPAAVEVGSDGQRAFESGNWVGTTETEGGRRLAGRYSAYWRRVDGAWRIHAELFVTLSCDGTGCD